MAGNAGLLGSPLGSGSVDAYGNIVPSDQSEYVSMIQTINGVQRLIYSVNSNYSPGSSSGATPAGVPPAYQFSFDTIGQTIYKSIGHCRLPLKVIWAEGVKAGTTSGSPSTTSSATVTFAAALCAPIDPEETGSVAMIFAGATAIYNTDQGGVIVPTGTNTADAALLAASLAAAVVYPGDEAQLPATLIVNDKGTSLTNAFRGIRYIVFPDFPISISDTTNLSTVYHSTSTSSGSYAAAAVEFAAGAG
jgi:hypothetical protein